MGGGGSARCETSETGARNAKSLFVINVHSFFFFFNSHSRGGKKYCIVLYSIAKI